MDLNEQILKVFQNTINTIIELLPEGETQLVIMDKYDEILKLNKLKLEDNKIIFNFMKKIDKISKKISNKDESIFDENIFEYIPIKTIWSEHMEELDKNKIWKYLQTLCVININLNSSNELKQLLSGESTEIKKENKKDIKDLKNLKKLKSSINEINKEEEEYNSKNNDDENLKGLEGVFENTGIGKLAKNIAENMDFNSIMGNIDPNETDMNKVMQNMMNPANFMNIFNDINKQVKEKIEEGDISEETLKTEAQELYGSFSNNPLFSNMMNDPNLKKMKEQMNQSNDNNNTNLNPTQERLRNKLKNKK
jgi:hypothetical protein